MPAPRLIDDSSRGGDDAASPPRVPPDDDRPRRLTLALAAFAGRMARSPANARTCGPAMPCAWSSRCAIPESAIPTACWTMRGRSWWSPTPSRPASARRPPRAGTDGGEGPDGTWSNPVFVKLAGASFGLQAGVQSADVVLVFRNDRSLESLANGKITLGADAASPPARSGATPGGHRRRAEGGDLVVVARARPVRRDRAGRGGAEHRQRRQPQRLRPRRDPADGVRGPRAGGPSAAITRFRDALEEAGADTRAARAKPGARPWRRIRAPRAGAAAGTGNPATTTPPPDSQR